MISEQRHWLGDFRNPPAAYRPVPFWSWNEQMEPEEVRRQVDLMHEAGWGGAFVHSRIGLTTPYMGEAWFAAVDAVVDQCRQRGMKVWLYDEDKWPSGYAGGSVPMADERFRSHCLFARPIGQTPPKGAHPLGPPRGGVQVYQFIEPMGSAWFNGVSYANTLSREAMARFLVEAYNAYHVRYAQDYGDTIVAQFTDEPAPLSHHSRLPDGHLPFTPGLFDRFFAMHGYDPSDHLHLLFVDGEAAPRFRLHYFRTINDLFERHFSQQIGQWCEQHGLALTGHFMNEHAMYDQQRVGFAVMPNYRHQGIPGIDHLGRQVSERITAKQCQSVVNQQGKRRMLSELYGMSGQGMTFADRWWIGCQQIALGVNLLNPHLSLYTLAGCRKRDYPPNLFYQQPWWEVNRAVDEPLSRLCVAMSQGRYVAETLVVHPQQSTQALWQGETTPDDPQAVRDVVFQQTPTPVRERIEALDAQLKAVVDALLGAQLGFDLGDETILADSAAVEHHEQTPVLRVGAMRYASVVLPTMVTMSPTTLTLLKSFEQAGGRVLRCGDAPRWVDGEPSTELDAWLAAVPEVLLDHLPAAVIAQVAPAVALEDVEPTVRAGVLAHVRELEDGDRLVMLTNLHRVEHVDGATCHFSGDWRSAALLDPIDGMQRAVATERFDDTLKLTLDLAPMQTRLLRLSPQPASPHGLRLTAPPVRKKIDLPGEAWQVDRLDENTLPLDTARWCAGDGAWSAHAVPVLAIQERLNALKYDGPVSLRYGVSVAALDADQPMRLIVEHASRYEIIVNGQTVEHDGRSWWRDPRWHAIDVTGLLEPGDNVIELCCAAFQHGDPTVIEDAFARYGTELEAIYLVGAFAVEAALLTAPPRPVTWQQWGLPADVPVHVAAASSLRLIKPTSLTPGETVTQGMPFYAGRLSLALTLPPVDADDDERVLLQLERLDAAAAAVHIDERCVGHVFAPPYELDITEAIRSKGRSLSITLYGSLRNLLGPHHHPDGELPAVDPNSFSAYGGRDDVDLVTDVARWSNDGNAPPQWRADFTLVGFGNIGQARLCIVEAKRVAEESKQASAAVSCN
ncbi:hypothetical protein ACERK3_00100 [Phycisphaerales bacterium AB-hyl4]|uniref:Alpha-L-rhamnosidase-like protein n=1 Tax=Natronomicrosphaera hydrolytica TaxID=3242702 RepID=A0ABV4U1H1_9BACT